MSTEKKRAGKNRPFVMRLAPTYFFAGAEALPLLVEAFLSLRSAFLSVAGAEAAPPAGALAFEPGTAGVVPDLPAVPVAPAVPPDDPEVPTLALAEPLTAAGWAKAVKAAVDRTATMRVDLTVMIFLVDRDALDA